jgi:NADH-quinone oxidoreductase subunit J
MLTRDVSGEHTQLLYKRWWLYGIVAAALFALIVSTTFAHPWQIVQPPGTGQAAAIASSVEIGKSFMREYLLPFEVASVLLLVALVGAIVIAFEERARRRRVLTLAEEVALRQPAADHRPLTADRAPTGTPEQIEDVDVGAR